MGIGYKYDRRFIGDPNAFRRLRRYYEKTGLNEEHSEKLKELQYQWYLDHPEIAQDDIDKDRYDKLREVSFERLEDNGDDTQLLRTHKNPGGEIIERIIWNFPKRPSSASLERKVV